MSLIFKKLDEIPPVHREQVDTIFIESFAYMFEDFRVDENSLKRIFSAAFIPKYYHIAIENNRVVGFIAISDNTSRSIKLDKEIMKKEVGFFTANFMCLILRMLQKPEVKETNECYIDFVAVDKDFRSKGIGEKLFNHIHSITNCDYYYLDVLENNEKAKRFYDKIGYNKTPKKMSKILKIMGVPSLEYRKFQK